VDLRLGVFNLVRLAGAVLYLMLIAALYAWGGAGLQAVVVAQLIGNAVWFALPIVFLYPLPRMGFQPAVARSLLAYGLRAHTGNISAIETLRIDQLFIVLWLGTSDLGLYVGATTFILANRMIGTSVGMVAFPAAVTARRQQAWRLRYLVLLLASAAGITLPVILVEVVRGRELLNTVLGNDFEAAARPLAILAAASLCMNLRQVCSDWLPRVGRAGIASAGEVSAFSTLALFSVLLRQHGVEGIAWAVLTASTVALVAVLAFATLVPRFAGLPRSAGSALFVAACLVGVSAGAAMLVVSLGLSTGTLEFLGLVTLFLGPALWRLHRNKFDLLDPVLWISATFFAIFVVRPAWRMLTGDFIYNGYDVRDGLHLALTVGAAGYVAILLGYLLPIGARLSGAFPRMSPQLYPSTVLAYSLAISLAGGLLFALFILSSGGLEFFTAYVSSRSVGQSATFGESSAYLYYAPYLGIPALLLLIRCAPRNTRLIYWGVAVAPASLALLNAFGRGNRIWLLPLIGSLFLLYYLSRRRRPRLLTAVSVLLMVLVLFSAMRESRFAEQDRSLPQELLSFMRSPHEAAISLVESGDLGMVDALSLEMTAVPSTMPFHHGAVATSVLARPIPSVLWPSKPIGPDRQINELLWPDRSADTSYLPTFSALGELYADSGFLGVILGMALVGVTLRTVVEVWKHNPESPIAQIILALALPLTVVYLRGNAADTIGRMLFLVLPVLAVPLIASIRNPVVRTATAPSLP
jgi:hypothetical protein